MNFICTNLPIIANYLWSIIYLTGDNIFVGAQFYFAPYVFCLEFSVAS